MLIVDFPNALHSLWYPGTNNLHFIHPMVFINEIIMYLVYHI